MGKSMFVRCHAKEGTSNPDDSSNSSEEDQTLGKSPTASKIEEAFEVAEHVEEGEEEEEGGEEKEEEDKLKLVGEERLVIRFSVQKGKLPKSNISLSDPLEDAEQIGALDGLDEVGSTVEVDFSYGGEKILKPRHSMLDEAKFQETLKNIKQETGQAPLTLRSSSRVSPLKVDSDSEDEAPVSSMILRPKGKVLPSLDPFDMPPETTKARKRLFTEQILRRRRPQRRSLLQ